MNNIDEIIGMDLQRRQAMMNADVAALEGLFDNNLLWVHANGKADTKEGVLKSIGSERIKYLDIRCSEETVRFFGSVAILNGMADMDVVVGGEQKLLENRFTMVWAQQPDNSWKACHWQSTTRKAS